MVEEQVVSEESDKLNPKVIALDVLYGAVKGLSGLFFKTLMNLRIDILYEAQLLRFNSLSLIIFIILRFERTNKILKKKRENFWFIILLL